jgi:hypothetical protein
VRASDLTGEAAVLYLEWRKWGCSEAEALDLVERSGLLGSNPYEQAVYEASRSVFGSSPRAASRAALGDRAPTGDRRPKRNSMGVIKGVTDYDRQVDESIFRGRGGAR